MDKSMTLARRVFALQSLASVCAFAATVAQAQAPSAVMEADPQAVALGYSADGSKTDTKKYPNYATGQSCSGCVLFQGQASDSSAPCAAFGNKLVAGKGWCSAWTKKA